MGGHSWWNSMRLWVKIGSTAFFSVKFDCFTDALSILGHVNACPRRISAASGATSLLTGPQIPLWVWAWVSQRATAGSRLQGQSFFRNGRISFWTFDDFREFDPRKRVFLVSLVFQLPCILFPPPGLFSASILRGKHAQPQKFEMQIFVAGPMLMAGVNFRVVQGILGETCRKPWLMTEVSYGFLTLSWRVKTSQTHILTCSN